MPSYWYDKDRDADWRQVAGIYEFVANDHITLSKICERDTHSVTSRCTATIAHANTFRRNLEERDVACVVTGQCFSLVSSHLVPKRVGDEGAETIMERFVGEGEGRGIHRFHPSLGIL